MNTKPVCYRCGRPANGVIVPGEMPLCHARCCLPDRAETTKLAACTNCGAMGPHGVSCLSCGAWRQ